jgi:hypothetical protein
MIDEEEVSKKLNTLICKMTRWQVANQTNYIYTHWEGGFATYIDIDTINMWAEYTPREVLSADWEWIMVTANKMWKEVYRGY